MSPSCILIAGRGVQILTELRRTELLAAAEGPPRQAALPIVKPQKEVVRHKSHLF